MSIKDGKYWDVSWNPLRGCTPISPGCDHCWAETVDKIYNGGKDFDGTGPHWHPEVLGKLSHWKKPRHIFVCDMSDAFYWGISNAVHEHHLDQREIFCGMKAHPRHTYLLLTKRPENMAWWQERWQGWWGGTPANWWAGVTAENQEWADRRIPILVQIQAAVRWVSLEPLLGPVDLRHGIAGWEVCKSCGRIYKMPRVGHAQCDCSGFMGGRFGMSELFPLDFLDWIVVGSESRGGRAGSECKLDWVVNIVDQCHEAGVPVWVKQLPFGGKVVHEASLVASLLGESVEQIRQYPVAK